MYIYIYIYIYIHISYICICVYTWRRDEIIVNSSFERDATIES